MLAVRLQAADACTGEEAKAMPAADGTTLPSSAARRNRGARDRDNGLSPARLHLNPDTVVEELTCAAVNGVALERQAPLRMQDVPAVVQQRTARVLTVAAAHDFSRLILGAWGCGAFGLDPH